LAISGEKKGGTNFWLRVESGEEAAVFGPFIFEHRQAQSAYFIVIEIRDAAATVRYWPRRTETSNWDLGLNAGVSSSEGTQFPDLVLVYVEA
jgi:hypothetical protein